MTPDGCAIIPPHIAHWLWKQTGLSPERRDRIRDADPEAYAVLMALRTAACNHDGTARGPKPVAMQDPPQELEPWLTTDEVAKELGIKPRAVCKRIDAGKLPATKRGRDWFVHRKDLPATGRRTDAVA
jgi:excisionase family DNA binding protein